MSYVLTFFAGMVFSAIAIFDSMVYDDSDELWCGCDGEGMAHTLGAKGFPCAAPVESKPKDAAWACEKHKTFGPSYLKCSFCADEPTAQPAQKQGEPK